MTPARKFRVVLSACVLQALPAAAQAQFPNIGGLVKGVQNVKKLGDSFRKIGEEEEVKLGGDLASVILGTAPLVQDAAKQRYVNRLGLWLALHSDRPNLPWKFGIVETADVNAFSMPGGYVLITRGMFDRMRNESELAGVLAHEISHVVRKDHINALQSSLRDSALGGFTDYVGGSTGGLAGQFKTALINAGKTMYMRGLDKDDEYDADRMGVVIAARAGYSPYGLVGVLQTLSAAPDDKGFALMNKTHPLPVDRLDRLDRAMGTKLDGVTNVVEDLPSFVALREPPRVTPAATKSTPRRGRRRN
ncbi:M48 family metalloprotease [Novosphingobium sp. G106]|uniref:M48 family metalloprotease n=1 Tax=Novosphingobium sp. G106 TaxID=2849500 RepID=UPI001C2D375B|nr:M48 family metalloprotease [Novosphingobium sp. G106]MBV1689727.1 M48 family metalloprotease [Novosphingobium sp. G106]